MNLLRFATVRMCAGPSTTNRCKYSALQARATGSYVTNGSSPNMESPLGWAEDEGFLQRCRDKILVDCGCVPVALQ